MKPDRVAVCGPGVMAAGWAARCLLFGQDVTLAPDSDAQKAELDRELERARSGLAALFEEPLPPEGRARHAATPADAVTGASLVVQAAPGHAAAAGDGAVVLLAVPGAMAAPGHAARSVIVRAAVPPWLAAAAEVVRSHETDAGVLRRAEVALERVGLLPIVTTAGWALMDDVADLVVRARAGDEAAQALLGQAVGPSLAAAQTGGEVSPDALVAVLRALKGGPMAPGHGAGRWLRTLDARLRPIVDDLSAPVLTVARSVPSDWGDYNGHMTEARYLHAFGDATDRFMRLLGCDDAYISAGGSFFTAETHIRHLGEVLVGQPIEVRTRVLSAEGKRMHLWHELSADGTLKATGEHMLIHVSLATRRPSPPLPPVSGRLAEVAAAHARLTRPEGAGRFVGQPR